MEHPPEALARLPSPRAPLHASQLRVHSVRVMHCAMGH